MVASSIRLQLVWCGSVSAHMGTSLSHIAWLHLHEEAAESTIYVAFYLGEHLAVLLLIALISFKAV